MILATRLPIGNAARLRERIEFQICREWRSSGKFSWSDAELTRAIEERLQQMRPAEQLPLFDVGDAANETRAAAAKESAKRAEDLQTRALKAFSDAGRDGCTRYELAKALGVQQSSICRTVLALLRAGEVAELRERRISDAGGLGCVLVLREYAEVSHASGV